MALGSRRSLTYEFEDSFGNPPAVPDMKLLRNTGDSLDLTRNQIQSGELRDDRGIVDARQGNDRPQGNIDFELSFEAFDDFLAAALFGLWTVAYQLADLAVNVVASAGTFTRGSGDWEADGVKVGDRVIFSGFTNPGNNGTFVVTAVAGTVLTCADATGLADESAGSGVGATTDREVVQSGTTLRTLAIEKQFADIGQYELYTGMAINSMSLSITPEQIVTGQFGLIGSTAVLSGVSRDDAPQAAPTNSPFDSFTGEINEGGSDIAVATQLSIQLQNGIEPKFALMQRGAHHLGSGRSNLTGSLQVYFLDATMKQKFLQETESSIQFTLQDLAGNRYRFTIPRAQYQSAGTPVSNENDIVMTMNFQGLHDANLGTNLQIEKIPAA